MACQIKRNSNGTIAQVLAPNGKDSILYQDLVTNLSNPQMMAMVTQDPYVNMVLGTEYVKDTSVEEVALAAWSKAYTTSFIEQFGNWKVKTIANTDVNGEPVVSMLFPDVGTSSLSTGMFNKQLAQKIQNKLQQLYPEIKLNITNNPVWEQGDNILNQQQYDLEVNYRLKATKVILDNYDKIKGWETNKSITKDVLYKKIGELGITKQQLDLLKESEGNTIEEKLASFIATYSYTVEINTAKNFIKAADDTLYDPITGTPISTVVDDNTNTAYYSNLTVPGGTNYTENEIATPAITPSIKGHAQFATDKGIGWFRSDDLINVYAKHSISKREKMWKSYKEEGWPTDNIKTRRILELQSDLFQKGRDLDDLSTQQDLGNVSISKDEYDSIPVNEEAFPVNDKWKIKEYNNTIYFNYGDGIYDKTLNNDFIKENQFLQLLNKDNNWVTFFIKSIIQDSAEKGYEKVLFPTGNTASKVEGHTTLEEFKKQKEDRIRELEKVESEYTIKQKEDGTWDIINSLGRSEGYSFDSKDRAKDEVDKTVYNARNEIQQLKQELERVETEGFGALKPVYNFYETTVANVIKKQGYQPVQVTDEYGNTWNQVSINQARDLSEILLQRDKANKIIGQANIKAMTVLIDAANQKQDTLPHEYAHHYIAWYRNSPIVQEAIKKWGSEEALVQAIGEQVVKQKGEAYNWWQKFVKWILDKFNSLSKLDRQELTQILTDAFLTRQKLDIPTTTVKEDIDFVFEQNPELANAVYEAAGFKTFVDNNFSIIKNNKLYPYELEKGINTYEIHYKDRVIGKIAVFDSGKNITIKGLEFNQSERNKGLGKAFYKWLNNEANKKGGVLWGDPEQISPDAYRVWESLNKEGLVDITKSTPRFLEPQITPQQKQQAQQLYSNYLDTIFPNSMVKQIMYHGSPIGKISEIDKRFAITYWSTSIDYVRSSNLWKGNITTALLDIRNPLFTNKPLASAPPEVTEFLSPGYTPETYDSVIGVDAGQELVGGRTIAVKNQKADTHILGSKKDIEGFKKYVQGKTQGSGMTKLLDLIGMKRWTQTKNNCPKL